MQHKAFIFSRTICGVIVLYFFSYEVRQAIMKNSYLEYFKELWNYNDILFLFVYPIYIIVAFERPE
jgi:hypothetical protein